MGYPREEYIGNPNIEGHEANVREVKVNPKDEAAFLADLALRAEIARAQELLASGELVSDRRSLYPDIAVIG